MNTEKTKANAVTVTVECIGCADQREIKTDEIAKDDFPICKFCGMPMLPIKAEVKL